MENWPPLYIPSLVHLFSGISPSFVLSDANDITEFLFSGPDGGGTGPRNGAGAVPCVGCVDLGIGEGCRVLGLGDGDAGKLSL